MQREQLLEIEFRNVLHVLYKMSVHHIIDEQIVLLFRKRMYNTAK